MKKTVPAGRRTARELSLQLLYHIEISKDDVEGALSQFWSLHPTPKEVAAYSSTLVKETRARIDEIDAILTHYAANWRLDRMATVDRNVLRQAVCEMLFIGDIPPVVVIDEAVTVAKKYSTPEAGAFVNGILDRIRKERLPEDETSGGEPSST